MQLKTGSHYRCTWFLPTVFPGPLSSVWKSMSLGHHSVRRHTILHCPVSQLVWWPPLRDSAWAFHQAKKSNFGRLSKKKNTVGIFLFFSSKNLEVDKLLSIFCLFFFRNRKIAHMLPQESKYRNRRSEIGAAT